MTRIEVMRLIIDWMQHRGMLEDGEMRGAGVTIAVLERIGLLEFDDDEPPRKETLQ